MKLYLIKYEYFSSNDGNRVVEAIYSSYEKAYEHIKNSHGELERRTHRKTGKLLDSWTDGDYCVTITEGYLDSPALYISKEDYETL